MLSLNKKFIIHQIFFVILGLIIAILPYEKDNIAILGSMNKLFLVSLILISTIGIGHGALDGKIIWKNLENIKSKFYAYFLYLIIVLLAILLWLISPAYSIMLLIIMSIVHFGDSDLKGFEFKNIEKLSWGFMMSTIPLILNSESTNEIILMLIGIEIDQTIIFIFSIFFLFSLIIVSVKIIKNQYYPLGLCLITLILLGNLIHPFLWFGYYFSFYHGLKALINNQFSIKKDILWIIFFSFPVIILWVLINQHMGIIEIIFPTLFALTVAHMQIHKILKLVTKKVV